jgi:hypothetical protein
MLSAVYHIDRVELCDMTLGRKLSIVAGSIYGDEDVVIRSIWYLGMVWEEDKCGVLLIVQH